MCELVLLIGDCRSNIQIIQIYTDKCDCCGFILGWGFRVKYFHEYSPGVVGSQVY